MQVAAFATPSRPDWRWRIVNYEGEMVEESRDSFPSIASAITDGSRRLTEINVQESSRGHQLYRSTSYSRRS